MTLSRASGILLHITSLPGPFGIGDLGPNAFRFADFLASTGQRIWQLLPIVPIGYGNSPYAGLSTFAGNPLLISPELLRDAGLLEEADLTIPPDFAEDPTRIDFPAVIAFKEALLRRAFERFGAGAMDQASFDAFCEKQSAWLDDYALFETLKDDQDNRVWTAWDPPLAAREEKALASARRTFYAEIRMHKFWQFLFQEQWSALKTYCNARDIQLFGDLPIYVAHDSADVWANPELFYLEPDGTPTVVAGVPPDYFSETGQRWGNPIYRWKEMENNGFAWWVNRFSKMTEAVDLVRLDHFRGFEAYWEVPAEEETAVKGRWVKGPGATLFDTLKSRLGHLPVIAENLGLITPEVEDLMARYDFPGMAILQFGFDGDADAGFLPHNYVPELVAYTGTHDNDTVVGWWTNTASTQSADAVARAHQYCRQYLAFKNEDDIHWAFTRALFGSVAGLAIVPLQDLLGLGAEARMNTPGLGDGNWAWRFRAENLTKDLAHRLKLVTEIYGRAAIRQPEFDTVED